MKLVVVGDLHDNLRNFSKAIEVINKLDIDMVAFVGDFDMPFTMRTFKLLKCPIKAVLGNGDPDIQKFQYQLQNLEILKDLKLDISPRFQDFMFGGKRIGIFHGDDENLTKALVESQLFDVLCIGHTHILKITQENRTKLINPGSLVGYMFEKGEMPIYVVVYDTETNEAKVIEIDA